MRDLDEISAGMIRKAALGTRGLIKCPVAAKENLSPCGLNQFLGGFVVRFEVQFGVRNFVALILLRRRSFDLLRIENDEFSQNPVPFLFLLAGRFVDDLFCHGDVSDDGAAPFPRLDMIGATFDEATKIVPLPIRAPPAALEMMLDGVKLKDKRIYASVGFPGYDVAVRTAGIRCPHLPPREQVLF